MLSTIDTASVKFSKNSEDISVAHHLIPVLIFVLPGNIVFISFHDNFSTTLSFILFNTIISTIYAALSFMLADMSHQAEDRHLVHGLTTSHAIHDNHCSYRISVSCHLKTSSILSVIRFSLVAVHIITLSAQLSNELL